MPVKARAALCSQHRRAGLPGANSSSTARMVLPTNAPPPSLLPPPSPPPCLCHSPQDSLAAVGRLEAELASAGDKYTYIQRLRAYVADLCNMLAVRVALFALGFACCKCPPSTAGERPGQPTPEVPEVH